MSCYEGEKKLLVMSLASNIYIVAIEKIKWRTPLSGQRYKSPIKKILGIMTYRRTVVIYR